MTPADTYGCLFVKVKVKNYVYRALKSEDPEAHVNSGY
jgi:hypothetical protein